jgi:hypothetical protein
MPLGALDYPEELLPALASLSPDTEMRALWLQEERWRDLYRLVVSQMQREAVDQLGGESDQNVNAPSTEVGSKTFDEDRIGYVSITQGPPLPRPTTEMVRAAHAAVAVEREKWAADVERFRSSRERMERTTRNSLL